MSTWQNIQIEMKNNSSPEYFIQGHIGRQHKGWIQTASDCKRSLGLKRTLGVEFIFSTFSDTYNTTKF